MKDGMHSGGGTGGWKSSQANVFWGKIAPCEHVVQFYESETIFLESLAGFVGDGINSGDSCIIIATPSHIKTLEDRLTAHGIHVNDLISEKRYVAVDAEETLARFMVNDWPDENLFNKTVTELFENTAVKGRKIRAFGEMVAMLWQRGLKEATLQLENLWNKFCQNHAFCLFCAYPQNGFPGDHPSSTAHICESHSKIISGSVQRLNQVTYRDVTVN